MVYRNEVKHIITPADKAAVCALLAAALVFVSRYRSHL